MEDSGSRRGASRLARPQAGQQPARASSSTSSSSSSPRSSTAVTTSPSSPRSRLAYSYIRCPSWRRVDSPRSARAEISTGLDKRTLRRPLTASGRFQRNTDQGEPDRPRARCVSSADRVSAENSVLGTPPRAACVADRVRRRPSVTGGDCWRARSLALAPPLVHVAGPSRPSFALPRFATSCGVRNSVAFLRAYGRCGQLSVGSSFCSTQGAPVCRCTA